MISSNYWDRYKYSPQIRSLLESLHPTAMKPARGLAPREGGGAPHMKGVGMLVGNFEFNP